MLENQVVDNSGEQFATPIGRFMAATLARHGGLAEQDTELFKKIVADLILALQQGHICINISSEEQKLMKSGAVVAEDQQAPLVLSENRLYFGRYFRYESDLAEAMKKLAVQSCAPRAESVRADDDVDDERLQLIDDPFQNQAVAIALSKGLCIISGGPGTGKTTIIVKIIYQLLAGYGSDIKIGLAAPTGKAAMRMQESIRTQMAEMGLDQLSASAFPTEAQTLHRMLGLGRFSKKPKYDSAKPMAYDVVLVDEASMVDLAMMWKLISGLKKGARLILIGDRDQLASVESGAVLADCIDSLPKNVAELKKSFRFNEQIAAFADAVKSGDSDAAWSLCCQSGSTLIEVVDSNWLEIGAELYKPYMKQAATASSPDSYQRLFQQFNSFRILCALRNGRYGVEEINDRIELLLGRSGAGDTGRLWYSGRPIIISRNDHGLGLFNGDIGICLPDPESDGELRVWFEGGDHSLRKFIPGQIPVHETAWAMTIHKSQGSEFDQIVIVLPEKDNRILCRELLYTAITRARKKISLVVSEEICKIAVSRNSVRHSGLAERLGQENKR